MAGTATRYPSLTADLWRGKVVLEGDLKLMLVGPGYKFSPGHARRSQVNGEVKGGGYDSGGKAVANNRVGGSVEKPVLLADDVVWSPATVTATGAVLYYHSGGGPSQDPLVAYFDFDGPMSATNGPFLFRWKDGCIFTS